jgi:hypothetical protein|tara:strand:+ start:884 stop:2128 length:1245 start_codon:yes stop_codon:yes gene_type:complete
MGESVNCKTIDCCRISGSRYLEKILDLGKQPLANSLKNNADNCETTFPLSISYCPDSSLLQLNETIDKNILFDHYVWVTGTSAVARIYAENFAKCVIEISGLDKDDMVVEIASNDGTFLKPFLKKGYLKILGVDPARNVAETANKQGIRTLPDFWCSALAEEIISDYDQAKVVIARNVMPHMSELLDVISGIELILQKDGVGVIEFHDAGKILEELHYDSIYHEHLCYFSIQSMTYLLNRFSLNPFHIENSPISGGSWVIYFSKDHRHKSSELENAINEEVNNKVNKVSSWHDFAHKAKIHRRKTLDMLNSLNGKKVIGFGSSARSQTYLNYCDINIDQMEVIIDNNPLKQGLFAPGSSIPIVNFNQGMSMKPELIFILAWNFRDEIVKECRANEYKGEFLVPFPSEPYHYNGE